RPAPIARAALRHTDPKRVEESKTWRSVRVRALRPTSTERHTMRTTLTLLASAVLGLSAASGLAEPISGVLSIQRLATIEDMGRMAVNPATGEIAFGRTGPGSNDAHFIRVLAPNGLISQAGDVPIRDPDAVAWDMDGSFGPAG